MSELKARYVDGPDNEILKEIPLIECGEAGFRHIPMNLLPEPKLVNA